MRKHRRWWLVVGWCSFVLGLVLLLTLSSWGCTVGIQQTARIRGTYFEIFEEGRWKPFFMKGMNVSLAFPGYRPGHFSAKIEQYAEVFERVGAMNINTVRIYTLQPPVFYKALQAYNLAHPKKPLWLLQGVWLDEVQKDSNDYFSSPITTSVFKREIERIIDAIHGNIVVPYRSGWAYGNYKYDVSPWTVGILLGREMEPYIVDGTNRHHQDKTSFIGDYFTIKDVPPIDVWAVGHLDYTLKYEQEKYGLQRPVGMSNWATLDPLRHAIEPPWSAEDVTTLDLNKVKMTSRNTGGMFISYHLYPYYPNFVNLDPLYNKHVDHIGNNPYEAYLIALKQYYKTWPVLAAEYGLPATMATVHTSSSGMNHGMPTEMGQAKGVIRMTENVLRAGLAGGCIFVWMDEWFKRTWALDPLQELSRIPKWHNMLSPEENYGMIAIEAYRPGGTVYLGQHKDWTTKPFLQRASQDRLPLTSSEPHDPMRKLKSLHVQYDQAFLFLRIDVSSLDPDGNGKIDWKQARYLIGVDTYDPDRGESKLDPKLRLRMQSRVEFVIEVFGDANGKPVGQVKVIPSYDTYGIWHGVRTEKQFYRSVASDTGVFNLMRWIMEDDLSDGRDVRKIIQKRQNFSIGALQYGHQVKGKPGYNAMGQFYGDIKNNTLSFRIPWSLLHVTDPSSLHVLHDLPHTRNYEHRNTDGFRFVIASVRPGPRGKDVLADVLPGGPRSDGGITDVPTSPTFLWQGWEIPTYRERVRPIYHELTRFFAKFPENFEAYVAKQSQGQANP